MEPYEIMLTLTMRHTGELYLKTPESEHPLNKKLILTIDPSLKGVSVPHVLSAMEDDILDAVLWFFDLYLYELVDFAYAPEQSKFALNLMRSKLLSEIEATIRNGVTTDLESRNVSYYEIIDI